MKKNILLVLIVLLGAGVLYGLSYYSGQRNDGPLATNPPSPPGEVDEDKDPVTENTTGISLQFPENFTISTLAKNITGARDIEMDGEGNLWVSQTSQGLVTKLTIVNGVVTETGSFFRNLNNPHGLAFDPQNPDRLYIAEEHRIVLALLRSDAPLQKIVDLPSGGGHFTRTIKFGPDDRLYVSIGSSCNVCDESDSRRAAIYSMNKDGSDFKSHATGLRNSVFFTWSEVDGRMWATDMGRDNLGDNLPPEEINIIEAGKFYGWPICYGNNIHDTNFDKKTYIRNPCMEPFETPPQVEMQAHSAPLGLDFVPEEGWPESMWYDLIVAFHGSWNRSDPTGYKLVRIKLEANGNYSGTEDFISGWLQRGQTFGRPVDVLIQPGGLMYVSDDRVGAIYKIQYNGS